MKNLLQNRDQKNSESTILACERRICKNLFQNRKFGRSHELIQTRSNFYGRKSYKLSTGTDFESTQTDKQPHKMAAANFLNQLNASMALAGTRVPTPAEAAAHLAAFAWCEEEKRPSCRKLGTGNSGIGDIGDMMKFWSNTGLTKDGRKVVRV